MSAKLKDTLNLPQTGFPMRANLVEREPLRLEHWSGLDLYERLQEKKITTRRDLSVKVGALHGQYTGQDVEADGKILTSAGDGEPTTRAFLKKFRGIR